MAIVKVSIKKTVQEEPYSPVVFDLGVEVEVEVDSSSPKKIREVHELWADELQETMEGLILKRMEEYK